MTENSRRKCSASLPPALYNESPAPVVRPIDIRIAYQLHALPSDARLSETLGNPATEAALPLRPAGPLVGLARAHRRRARADVARLRSSGQGHRRWRPRPGGLLPHSTFAVGAESGQRFRARLRCTTTPIKQPRSEGEHTRGGTGILKASLRRLRVAQRAPPCAPAGREKYTGE